MKLIIRTDKDRVAFIERMSAVPLDGKKAFLAEFKVFPKKRSMGQNSLYWCWLRCISAETGNDTETLHTFFASKYLPWEEKVVLENPVAVYRSTASLTVQEFKEYLDAIDREMINQNIYLPQPGMSGFEEFRVRYEK